MKTIIVLFALVLSAPQSEHLSGGNGFYIESDFSRCWWDYVIPPNDYRQVICHVHNGDNLGARIVSGPVLASIAKIDHYIEYYSCAGGTCARLATDFTINMLNPLPFSVPGRLEVDPFYMSVLYRNGFESPPDEDG